MPDMPRCENCKTGFIPKKHNQKFCTDHCYYDNAKKRAKYRLKEKTKTIKINKSDYRLSGI